MNFRIEEDVHVVCFDKSDAFDFMPVFIPYIHQPIADMGRLASQLLIKQIEEEEAGEEPVHKLSARLIKE